MIISKSSADNHVYHSVSINVIPLNYRQETLFCVSSSLVCDGINHCPSGEEYTSDEDPAMCARQRGFTDSNVCILKGKKWRATINSIVQLIIEDIFKRNFVSNFRHHLDWAYGSKYQKSSLVNCIHRMIQRHQCHRNWASNQHQRCIKNRVAKTVTAIALMMNQMMMMIRPMIAPWNHQQLNITGTLHYREAYRNMDRGAI